MILGHIANIDLVILFFFLGIFASWIKSDLEIPEQISKFLSIFLLLALGLKGGHEVRVAESLSGLGALLVIGLGSCLLIPLYLYFWHRKKMGVANAAAIAACYGSVSAVTFIAAQGYLANEELRFSGFMVAVMALMEIPAIVLALHLVRKSETNEVHEAHEGYSIWTTKSVVLLAGGFVIGLMMNDPTRLSIKPVVHDAFKGILVFFLLDLGIVAQKQIAQAWKFKRAAVLIGWILPLIHGSSALVLASLFGITEGDTVLLAALVGSASYIAAPAAIRSSIPAANPSLFVSLPLALTFPMNVLIGIPLYIEMARLLYR